MQFSIFGVPFKCTKDMFTWEKAKWSFFTYWTMGWRVFVLCLSTFLLAFGMLLLPAILGAIQDIPLGENADFSLILLLKFVHSFGFWKEHYMTTGIVLLVLLLIASILGGIYIHYYGIFKKNYTSYNRNYEIPVIPTIKSWNFWKRYIFVTILGLGIGFILGFVLGLLHINETIIQAVGFVVGCVFFHITLHGGAWGFIPVRKKNFDTKSDIKS